MKTRLLVATLVAFAITISAFASSAPVVPDLDQYPVMPGPLTVSQMAAMSLRPQRLVVSGDYLNQNRRTGKFEVDHLEAGELVLVDTSGVVRYKASCGNRLAEISANATINDDVFKPAVQELVADYNQDPSKYETRVALVSVVHTATRIWHCTLSELEVPERVIKDLNLDT